MEFVQPLHINYIHCDNILFSEETEMKKFVPPKPQEEEDDFVRDQSGIPYLLFKRVGSIGIEKSATIGETIRICTGKGLSTNPNSTHESYRGRTSCETFMMLNLGNGLFITIS